MSFWALLLTAIALSMDAFAVSICKGLAMRRINWKGMLLCGVYFGFFQALMPLIGYLLGQSFQSFIDSFDHWLAFGLLALIGANMIKESFSKEEDDPNDKTDCKTMLLLAIATSIDALAAGVSFAFVGVDILPTIALIGAITFVVSVIGVRIGHAVGEKFKAKAEFVGGVVLIFMGINILAEQYRWFG